MTGPFWLKHPWRVSLNALGCDAMSLEPTVDEASALTSVQDVGAWVGLRGDPADATTEFGSLLQLIGTTPTEHLRVIGSIPEADYTALIAAWTIATVQPSPAQGAKAAVLGRACRICCGAQMRVEDIVHQLRQEVVKNDQEILELEKTLAQMVIDNGSRDR